MPAFEKGSPVEDPAFRGDSGHPKATTPSILLLKR